MTDLNSKIAVNKEKLQQIEESIKQQEKELLELTGASTVEEAMNRAEAMAKDIPELEAKIKELEAELQALNDSQ